MNCQTFSELASDIAREQMMDASARAEALAHANDCVDCTVRLRAQQHLTVELRELLSDTKDQTASAMVWERLSLAFDSRTMTPIATNRRRRIYAAGAIAATLVVAFAVTRMSWHRQPAKVEASIAAAFSPAPPTQTTSERSYKDVIVRADNRPLVSPHRRSAMGRQALALQVNQPKEIATDFILLTYDSEVGSDAQMVRVELPRSAMASFGLPVNMDRADQRVKADVLLGADGLARAIRFVQ